MLAITTSDLRRIRHRLGLSQGDCGRMLGVSTWTVQRWERRDVVRMRSAPAGRLTLARDIASLASEGDPAEVAVLLATPRRSLDLRTPRQALVDGDLDQVRQLLIQRSEGTWG